MPAEVQRRARIQLFAVLAETAGADHVDVPLPPGATAQSALQRLGWLRPELARYLRSCRLARDDAFLAPADPVRAGESLAAIPPTSGG